MESVSPREREISSVTVPETSEEGNVKKVCIKVPSKASEYIYLAYIYIYIFMLHNERMFNVPYKMISGPKICRKGMCGRGECVLTSTPPYYECKCKLPFQPPDCRTCEHNYHFIYHQRNEWPVSFLLSCFNLLSERYCRVSAAWQIIKSIKAVLLKNHSHIICEEDQIFSIF